MAKKVVGVVFGTDAIVDAETNSEANGINNPVFYAGDMKDILNNDFINQNGNPDEVIRNPPSAGMHPDVDGNGS